MEVDEEDFKKYIEQRVSATGSEDEDAFYEVYTVDNYDGKRYRGSI